MSAAAESDHQNSPRLHVEKDGPVRVLTIDVPPANCYSYPLMKLLDEAILEARFDPETHVIILRSEGSRFFCAGADISMLQEVTPEWKYSFCLHANETLSRLEQTPKLVIAEIEGHCVGGGLEMALACDLRIACEDSGKMGVPEVQLGVLPGTGGTQRLARLLGKASALEWCIEGRMVTMNEALSEGLVQKLFPKEGFSEAVREYAHSLAPPKSAGLAVGLIKRSIQGGADLGLQDGLSLERELQQRLFQSEDAKEGMAANREKRHPEFEGR
jgi:enoyl-CoA hydratase